jgi:hypothetical protein
MASGRGRCFVRICAAGGRLRRPRRLAGHVGREVARLAAGWAAFARAELAAGRLGGAGIGDPQP